ncbi:hypothetical protein [Microbacterium sp.]|uniref:hypothetical protein n=1 Tax=Microbacterium sp. TaxID=51671 RepID=UPI002FE12E90
MTDVQQSPASLNAKALGPASRRIGALAMAFGLTAWLSLWAALSVTPWIIRANVSGGDLANVYAAPLAIWVAIVAVHLIGLILGVVAMRRRAGTGLGISALTMCATGLLGLALYFVATYALLPVIA